MTNNEKPSQEKLNEWHNDPANWKLGVIYYNKEDKRIFPPKRMSGFGWTINFANPLSILALLGLIAIFFTSFQLVSHYFHLSK